VISLLELIKDNVLRKKNNFFGKEGKWSSPLHDSIDPI
jgi:hypothetical protein